ncbi:EamA family transporter [Treponema endosymbiont of Eucomonympha sp.]|uniref:EamA family transporter n=1 Tax=Treponema endosymbiont of Eucomonympha sp. TaxID=1580831 RepID=UPI0007816670
MWVVYSLLSAISCAVMTVLAKINTERTDSRLLIAFVVTIEMLVSWTVVLFSGLPVTLAGLSKRNIMLIIADGIMAGVSGVFFFRAMQFGPVSKVIMVDKSNLVFSLIMASLLFHEPVLAKSLIGSIFVVIGIVIFST